MCGTVLRKEFKVQSRGTNLFVRGPIFSEKNGLGDEVFHKNWSPRPNLKGDQIFRDSATILWMVVQIQPSQKSLSWYKENCATQCNVNKEIIPPSP